MILLRIASIGLVLTSLSLVVRAIAPEQHHSAYVIVDEQPLTDALNQISGSIQVLEDARLTPALNKALWGTGGIDVGDEPALPSFKSNPPRNAEVRIVDRAGEIVETHPLERPLVKLARIFLYGTARPTYLVTVDYSAGFGSYSGPITFLVEVHDGRLHWLEATDQASGKTKQIALMESLKTVWKIVDAPGTRGKEILHAACRPTSFAANSDDFSITYSRYYFDGENWIRAERMQKGFTEFEDGFPSRKLFP